MLLKSPNPLLKSLNPHKPSQKARSYGTKIRCPPGRLLEGQEPLRTGGWPLPDSVVVLQDAPAKLRLLWGPSRLSPRFLGLHTVYFSTLTPP